jgi:hypothetical protein
MSDKSPQLLGHTNQWYQNILHPKNIGIGHRDVVPEKCRIPLPAAGFLLKIPIPALAPAPAAGMPDSVRNLAFAGIPAFLCSVVCGNLSVCAGMPE